MSKTSLPKGASKRVRFFCSACQRDFKDLNGLDIHLRFTHSLIYEFALAGLLGMVNIIFKLRNGDLNAK